MNPLLQDLLTSVLRKLLMVAATWLVTSGAWSGADAEKYTSAFALALVSTGWGLWRAYHNRQKIVTGLAMPAESTEAQVDHVIAAGMAPPATLPKTAKPMAIGPADIVRAIKSHVL